MGTHRLYILEPARSRARLRAGFPKASHMEPLIISALDRAPPTILDVQEGRMPQLQLGVPN